MSMNMIRVPFIGFLLSAALIVLLGGCLNFEQEVSLNPDGSGSMKIHYWMQIPPVSKDEILPQLNIFNKDSLTAQFNSKDIKLHNLTVVADTTDSTFHTRIEFEFVHIDSLNKLKPFSDAGFSLQDGAAGQKIFSQFIAPVASGFGLEDAAKFHVSYVYSFPGEIITHNATTVGKKTLTWSYTLDQLGKGKTISVTYRPFKLKETPTWIFILAGAMLVIVTYFLFRKRRD